MLDFVLFPSRAAAAVLSVFGVLALTIVSTGIYGLVTYAIAKRRREIGIRLAMARRARRCSASCRWRRALDPDRQRDRSGCCRARRATPREHRLPGVPRDPVVLASVLAVLSAAGILASIGPARRSLRIQPTEALRSE